VRERDGDAATALNGLRARACVRSLGNALTPPGRCADPNVYPSGKARRGCGAACAGRPHSAHAAHTRLTALAHAPAACAPALVPACRSHARAAQVCLVRLPTHATRAFHLTRRRPATRTLTWTHACPVFTPPSPHQSILNDEKGWKPSVTVKQILTGVQELLDSPNNADAAQEPAWRLFGANQAKYIERVKLEVQKYIPKDGGAGAIVL
jgi:hypothetical protein